METMPRQESIWLWVAFLPISRGCTAYSQSFCSFLNISVYILSAQILILLGASRRVSQILLSGALVFGHGVLLVLPYKAFIISSSCLILWLLPLFSLLLLFFLFKIVIILNSKLNNVWELIALLSNVLSTSRAFFYRFVHSSI